MVKRSRRRPLTAESRVRFPLAVPQRQNCYPIISNLSQISPLCALVLTIRVLSMALSTVSIEPLEWRKMVINKIWTSVRTSIFVKCFICYFCTLKFFPPYLSCSVFENTNLLSYTQPLNSISVVTSDHAAIVDIITVFISILMTRTQPCSSNIISVDVSCYLSKYFVTA